MWTLLRTYYIQGSALGEVKRNDFAVFILHKETKSSLVASNKNPSVYFKQKDLVEVFRGHRTQDYYIWPFTALI